MDGWREEVQKEKHERERGRERGTTLLQQVGTVGKRKQMLRKSIHLATWDPETRKGQKETGGRDR